MQRGACLPRRGFDRFERGRSERAETGFHFLGGNVAPMTPKDFCARDVDFFRGALARDKYQQRQRAFAAGKLQINSAARRGQARPFSGSARGRARGCFSCNFRKNAPRGEWRPVRTSALDQNIFVENEISVRRRP